MKILKRTLSVLTGLLLSLVILEAGLQTASFIIKTVKQYKINKIVKNKSDITILCLGESTTDGQWPPILQKILDEKSENKKFNVIDVALKGCNSDDILNNIKENLKIYKPDVIFSMMGINDDNNEAVRLRKYNFKTQKMLYWINRNLLFKINKNLDNNVENCFRYINYEMNYKNFPYAIKLLENLKDEKLNKKQIYHKYEAILICIIKMHVYQESEDIVKNCIDKIKENSDVPQFSEFVYYVYKKDKKALENFFCLMNEKEFNNFVGSYFGQIMFHFNALKNMRADDILFKINKFIYASNNSRFLGYMFLDDFVKNNYMEADKYFDMQTEYLLNNINKNTLKNYRLLAKICEKNNIKLIAMQYPVRSVKPLKKILEGFDGVTFISNEENFKEALKKYKAEDIFRDRFAGDFGHCTELGNTLIAKNVAETILKLYE